MLTARESRWNWLRKSSRRQRRLHFNEWLRGSLQGEVLEPRQLLVSDFDLGDYSGVSQFVLTGEEVGGEYRLQLRDAAAPTGMLQELVLGTQPDVVITGTAGSDQLSIDLSNLFSVDESGTVTSRLPASLKFDDPSTGDADAVQFVGHSALSGTFSSIQAEQVTISEGVRLDVAGIPATDSSDAQPGNIQFSGGLFIVDGELTGDPSDSDLALSVAIAADATLGGSGRIAGHVEVAGRLAPGHDGPGQLTVDSLDLLTGASLVIDVAPDETASAEAVGTLYDQVMVQGSVVLNGTLEVILAEDHAPEADSSFDFLSYTDLSGEFVRASGLFSFPDGDRFWDLSEVESEQGELSLHLLVTTAPGELLYAVAEEDVEAFGEFLSDYFTPTPFGYNATFRTTGQFAAADFVEVDGVLEFLKERGRLIIGSDSATVFLGAEYGTDEAMGLQVSQTSAGAVAFYGGGYALSAEGDLELVGLTGMLADGYVTIEANTSQANVNELLTLQSGELIEVVFPADELLAFASTDEVTLTVPDALDVVGTLEASKDAENERLLVTISEMTLGIMPDGFEVFRFGGEAEFDIVAGEGFAMRNFRPETLSVLGVAVPIGLLYDPSEDMPPNADELLGTGPPEAKMEYPAREEKVDVRLLNRRAYLDIQFHDFSGLGIDNTSILDEEPLFTLGGQGLGDAEVDWEEVEDMGDDMYRFHLVDSDPSNDVDLFKIDETSDEPNEVTISFLAGSWKDRRGRVNEENEVTFELIEGSMLASGVVVLGPLLLEKPRVGMDGFSLRPTGGTNGQPLLTVSIGLGLETASLQLGSAEKQAESKFKGRIQNLLGSFDIGIDLNVPACLENPGQSCLGSVGATGAFSISAELLELEVPDVVKAKAEELSIQYDPNGEADQEILSVAAVELEIPKLNLVGQLNPYTPPGSDEELPGLVVRKNGFHLGEGVLRWDDEVTIGGILKVVTPSVSIANFGVTFGESFNFSGEIAIAAQEATLFPDAESSDDEGGENGGGEGGQSGGSSGSGGDAGSGTTGDDSKKAFSLSIVDGSDADDIGVRAALAFQNNVPSGFRFKADQMEANIGSFLRIFGAGIEIDTTATGNTPVVKFARIGAAVTAGPFSVSGEMRQFGFLSDGSFKTYNGFGVFLSAEGVDGAKLKWPSWLPIQLTSLGIVWRDINTDPTDFALIASAEVTTGPLPLKMSGSVEGLRIDVGLLKQGQFPITALESFSVTIGGDMGGAKLGGTIIGGILRIDEEGELISATDFDTPVANRVLFVGVEGKLEIAKK